MVADKRQVYLVVAAIAAVCLWRATAAWSIPNILTDSDDAMRLVTARDLLLGQAFTDTTQYRDNAPYGASMHWSRLGDLPVAALAWLGRGLGPEGAMRFAAIAWPLLLIAPAMILVTAISRRLEGSSIVAPALLVALGSIPVLTEFAPGRVDHHGLQMVLVTALAWAAMAGRRSTRAAAAAGLLAALSLALGLETLPYVLAVAGLAGLMLVFEPERSRRSVFVFAVTLGLGQVVAFLATTAPAFYREVWCDALALPLVVAAGLGTAALALAAFTCRYLGSWPLRMLVVTGLGLGSAVLAVMAYPQCLAGPYGALDPAVAQTMFPYIEEARPWLERLASAPAAALSIGLPLLVGLVAAGLRVRQTTGAKRVDWIVILVFVAISVLLMLTQIRAARPGALLAVPGCAWLVMALWGRFKAQNSAGRAMAVVLGWVCVSGLVVLAVMRLAEPVLPLRPEPDASASERVTASCLEPDAYAELARQPLAVVGAASMLGVHILLHTQHSVVATGYHRNGDGMRDLAVLLGDDEGLARTVVDRRGVDLFVSCGPLPSGADGWSWLERISASDAALQIYRVTGALQP